jgi:tetratricopeptide (TPR) repeat protein
MSQTGLLVFASRFIMPARGASGPQFFTECLRRWRQTFLAVLLFSILPAAIGGTSFQNIQPGTSTKAEVDLALGEPIGKPDEPDSYEYRAPQGVADVKRVVVRFFQDDMRVAGIDVYFKTPVPVDDLRARFGNVSLANSRADGRREEFFYPALQTILFDGGDAGAPVAAAGFVSPRTLADVYMERFNEHYAARRYKEAMVEAEKAVLVAPDYARGYVGKGLYYESQNMDDEAVSHYLVALQAKMSPRAKALAHLWLGKLYLTRKKLPDKARPEYEAAAAMAPDLAIVHVEYARYFATQKQDDMAMREFTRAVDMSSSSDQNARIALADFFYQRKQYDKALPYYRNLHEWAQTPVATGTDEFKNNLHFRYGFCLLNEKKWTEAIEVFELVRQKEPERAPAHANIAWIYLQSGQLEAAEKASRESLAAFPTNLTLNNTLAEALFKLDRLDEALKQAERTQGLKPDDGWYMVNVARCWAAKAKKSKDVPFNLGNLGGYLSGKKSAADETAKAKEWLQKAGNAGVRDNGDLAREPLFAGILETDEDLRKLLNIRK